MAFCKGLIDTCPERAAVCDASAEAITRHFRDNYPILLDGALTRRSGRRRLVRQARETLSRGRVDPDSLAPEVLRETLDAITAPERAETNGGKAGFVAIGPKHARIWWDRSILENLDDILARLDNPRSVLRFYDVTGLDPESGRWNDAFDIDVKLADAGHTAQFMRSDRVYIVDLGYVHADSRFLRLARTNTVALPREGRGEADTGETARCFLRPRNRRDEAALSPDAAARDWAANRPDSPERDIEAELAVRMLYRAFLKEGPRALRRARILTRRDAAILENEYAERRRARERLADRLTKQRPATGSAFLVARLDADRKAREIVAGANANQHTALLPAPARQARWAAPAEGEQRFAWYAALLATARTYAGAGDDDEATPVDAEIETRRDRLVRVVPMERLRPELTASLYSAPVFAAAQSLREKLAGMPVSRDRAATVTANAANREDGAAGESGDDDPDRLFGGSEAKRMAKAGVRMTRMALTLEGRMRPGARLKVAGRLVHADADGRFRLECVLSGKKASIPVRAGVSAAGEARSLINVEWEKRIVSERKP
ncbi:MAG: DUF4912 domain-containing protein [Planctomycetota bacterium]|nr:DUF4912 domain-containing protein [Planctomycetota bacterium]